jgi:hypothetical protein
MEGASYIKRQSFRDIIFSVLYQRMNADVLLQLIFNMLMLGWCCMNGNIDGNACYRDTGLQSPLSDVYVQNSGKLTYPDSLTVGITVRVKVDMMCVLKMYRTIRNCCSVLTKRRTICL